MRWRQILRWLLRLCQVVAIVLYSAVWLVASVALIASYWLDATVLRQLALMVLMFIGMVHVSWELWPFHWVMPGLQRVFNRYWPQQD